jgi:hypothetical protein
MDGKSIPGGLSVPRLLFHIASDAPAITISLTAVCRLQECNISATEVLNKKQDCVAYYSADISQKPCSNVTPAEGYFGRKANIPARRKEAKGLNLSSGFPVSFTIVGRLGS